MKKNKGIMVQKKEVRVGTIDDFGEALKEIIADPKKINQIPKGGVVYVSPEDLPKILSKERLRLLHEIRKEEVNVGRLAVNLHRNREHVSRDLSILERFGLVHMQKRGREAYPITPPEVRITL